VGLPTGREKRDKLIEIKRLYQKCNPIYNLLLTKKARDKYSGLKYREFMIWRVIIQLNFA
jgi:hypothetical protein